MSFVVFVVLDLVDKEYLTKGWIRLRRTLYHHSLAHNPDPVMSYTVRRSKTLTQQNMTQPCLLPGPPLQVAHQHLNWSMEGEFSIIQNIRQFPPTHLLAGYPGLPSLVFVGKHNRDYSSPSIAQVSPRHILPRELVPGHLKS